MAAAKPKPALPHLSFRAFLEDGSFCGLDLSPMVAAIVDASEGIPVDLPRDACVAAFGCAPEQLPKVARRTVCVSAGGRGGKSSRLLAPKALHASWTVQLPDVRTGERGRSVLIAPDKDLAEQDLDYVPRPWGRALAHRPRHRRDDPRHRAQHDSGGEDMHAEPQRAARKIRRHARHAVHAPQPIDLALVAIVVHAPVRCGGGLDRVALRRNV